MTIGTVIQIVIALALVIVLLVVGFATYNAEALRAAREMGRIRHETVIFSGVKDLAMASNETYNTVDRAHPNYRNLDASVNQKAGAEYTFNFWLYLSNGENDGKDGKPALPVDTSNDAVYSPDTGLTKWDESKDQGTKNPLDNNKPYVLLLRGDKTAYTYKNHCKSMKTDVMVKNPMVKIERGRVLVLEINTVQTPDGVREGSRDTCGEGNGTWNYMNSFRLALDNLNNNDLSGRWFMITVVVQDTYPIDPLPFRNKVRACIYVNGVKELDRYLDGRLASVADPATVLKNNGGNLYIAPTIVMSGSNQVLSHELDKSGDVRKVFMADLSYYNYALEPSTIKDKFNNGFEKKYAVNVSSVDSTNDASFMDNVSASSDKRVLKEVKER